MFIKHRFLYKMLKKIHMLIEIKKYEYTNNLEWNVNFFSDYKKIKDIYLYLKQLR